ncbi:metastasis suppressor 1 isoform X2 [Silurus meridionalis]|nr:metastasis suppressor 1 isoform X2 [Silurus meridionalis]
MEAVMEKECSALGGLFQAIINDMKSSYPVWEDFISKAGKLQAQIRTTVMAVAAFLDAFQKVADLATGTRANQNPTVVILAIQNFAVFIPTNQKPTVIMLAN